MCLCFFFFIIRRPDAESLLVYFVLNEPERSASPIPASLFPFSSSFSRRNSTRESRRFAVARLVVVVAQQFLLIKRNVLARFTSPLNFPRAFSPNYASIHLVAIHRDFLGFRRSISKKIKENRFREIRSPVECLSITFANATKGE